MNHDISYSMAIANIGYRIHYEFIKGHHVDHMPYWVNYGVSIVSNTKTFFLYNSTTLYQASSAKHFCQVYIVWVISQIKDT